MKLGTFAVTQSTGVAYRVGAGTEIGIVDLAAARFALLRRAYPETLARRLADAQVPGDLRQLLENGRDGLSWAEEAVAHATESGDRTGPDGATIVYDPADVSLQAPVPRPPGMACFTTWPSHIADSADKGFKLQFPDPDGDLRMYYKGNADSVTAPGGVLSVPPYADEIDVECEMAAIVMGDVKDLSPDEAEEAIAGYCIFNDVSVRGIQMEEMALGLGPTKGKDHDGGNVMGPWLVTRDEVGPVEELTMSLAVNGERWGSYSVGEMQWKFPDLLSYLSRGQTLKAGHVLTSGCFPGGSALDQGGALNPGDEVSMEITRLGELKCTIGAPASAND